MPVTGSVGSMASYAVIWSRWGEGAFAWEVKSGEIDCGAKPATFPNEYYHELFMQTQMNGWNDN